MSTNTVRLHRVLRATPEKVYRAFLDADAMAKWLPPNGFTGKVHHLDAKVGGTYKMSFTNFTTGHSHSFGGEYLELVPHERIRHTDKFDDPNLPGEMQTTITLKKVSCGTELNIVQEGIPDVIPPEACYLGWQESLTLLAKLVEAEIPGNPAAGCEERRRRRSALHLPQRGQQLVADQPHAVEGLGGGHPDQWVRRRGSSRPPLPSTAGAAGSIPPGCRARSGPRRSASKAAGMSPRGQHRVLAPRRVRPVLRAEMGPARSRAVARSFAQ